MPVEFIVARREFLVENQASAGSLLKIPLELKIETLFSGIPRFTLHPYLTLSSILHPSKLSKDEFLVYSKKMHK